MSKLHLSKSNKKLVGVCGGFAEMFNVDATLIRILVIIIGFWTAIIPVVFIYLICWAIIPQNNG